MKTGLLLIALLAAAPAGAETFHMKDGSRFDGSIVATKGDDVEVDVAGKTLTIRKDSIRWIDYGTDWDGKSVREGEFDVRVGLGGALPMAEQGFNQLARPGLASELSGMVQVDKRVGVGLRLDDSVFTVAYPEARTFAGTRSVNNTNVNEKANVDVSSLMLEVRYLLLPGKRISPFASVGAGISVYAERLEATPKPGSGGWADDGSYDPRVTENASGGLAAEVGGGLQFLLSKHYMADVAARWHYSSVDNTRFGFTGAQSVSLLAALGFRF